MSERTGGMAAVADGAPAAAAPAVATSPAEIRCAYCGAVSPAGATACRGCKHSFRPTRATGLPVRLGGQARVEHGSRALWAALLAVVVASLVAAVWLRTPRMPARAAASRPAPAPTAVASAPVAPAPSAASAIVFPPPLRTRIEPAERPIASPPQPSPSWHEGARGHEEAVAEQRETHAPLLLHFRVEWDPYAARFEHEMLREPEMERFLAGVVKVRLEPERSPEEAGIAQEHQVSAFPALYLVPAPGAAPVRVSTFVRGEDDTATVRAEKLAAELQRVMVAHAHAQLADGQAKLSAGDAAGARAAFDAALAIVPHELEALLWRAQAESKLVQTAFAMGDLTRAIDVAPEDPRAYLQLATTYGDLGQYDDAADVLDNLVRAAPQWRQGRAYVLRAEVRQRLGRNWEARDDFRLACDQGNAYACQQLPVR